MRRYIMPSFKRILVPLNLSDLDATCVRYAGMITRFSGTERLYFVHVAKRLEYPSSALADLPELARVPEDVIERMMKETVSNHLAGAAGSIDIRYEVLEGSILEQLLRQVHRHKIDLVVTGKAAEKSDAGDVPEKMARKSPCSVLVVPEKSTPQISLILVPVDYSEHSSKALRMALDIARSASDARLICLHAITVPPVYVHIGLRYEEFVDTMKGHAASAFETYIRDFDVHHLKVAPLFVANERPSKAIEETIRAEKPDLVIMGARGRTDTAAILLGSTTERIIRRTDVPVLAVKTKGHGMNFLEAFLSD